MSCQKSKGYCILHCLECRFPLYEFILIDFIDESINGPMATTHVFANFLQYRYFATLLICFISTFTFFPWGMKAS